MKTVTISYSLKQYSMDLDQDIWKFMEDHNLHVVGSGARFGSRDIEGEPMPKKRVSWNKLQKDFDVWNRENYNSTLNLDVSSNNE